MTKLRRFECRLETLRRSQDVHTFFVRELGQAFRIHWTTPFLFCFERLAGVARVNDQQ